MPEKNRFDYRWLIWVRFVVIAAAICVALLVAPKPAGPKRVAIATDTNGNPVLLGVSLGNTNIRDAVFRVMGATGLKVSIAQPSSLTN